MTTPSPFSAGIGFRRLSVYITVPHPPHHIDLSAKNVLQDKESCDSCSYNDISLKGSISRGARQIQQHEQCDLCGLRPNQIGIREPDSRFGRALQAKKLVFSRGATLLETAGKLSLPKFAGAMYIAYMLQKGAAQRRLLVCFVELEIHAQDNKDPNGDCAAAKHTGVRGFVSDMDDNAVYQSVSVRGQAASVR